MFRTGRRLVVVLGLAPLLQGCSAIVRSDVSVPVPPLPDARHAPPLTAGTNHLWHLGGRRAGARIEVAGVAIEAHLVNRADRTMFVGPFLLVPLPVVPVFFLDRGDDNVVEEAIEGTANGPVDRFVTLRLWVAPAGTGDAIGLDVDRVTIERADGSVLTPGPERRFARSPDGAGPPPPPIGRKGAWFDLRYVARVPVDEAITLRIGGLTRNGEPVEVPPIRYGRGREWVLGAGGL